MHEEFKSFRHSFLKPKLPHVQGVDGKTVLSVSDYVKMCSNHYQEKKKCRLPVVEFMEVEFTSLFLWENVPTCEPSS